MRHRARRVSEPVHTVHIFSMTLSAIQAATGRGPPPYTYLMTERMYSAPESPPRQRDHRWTRGIASVFSLPPAILVSSMVRSALADPDRKTSPRQASPNKSFAPHASLHTAGTPNIRSEERRVGKEC